MTSNNNYPSYKGEKGRFSDRPSSDDESADTVYQNGIPDYDINQGGFGEPTANAVNISSKFETLSST